MGEIYYPLSAEEDIEEIYQRDRCDVSEPVKFAIYHHLHTDLVHVMDKAWKESARISDNVLDILTCLLCKEADGSYITIFTSNPLIFDAITGNFMDWLPYAENALRKEGVPFSWFTLYPRGKYSSNNFIIMWLNGIIRIVNIYFNAMDIYSNDIRNLLFMQMIHLEIAVMTGYLKVAYPLIH